MRFTARTGAVNARDSGRFWPVERSVMATPYPNSPIEATPRALGVGRTGRHSGGWGAIGPPGAGGGGKAVSAVHEVPLQPIVCRPALRGKSRNGHGRQSVGN